MEAKKKFKFTMTHQIALTSVIGLIAGIIMGPKIAPVKVVGDIFLRLIMMGVPLIILGAVAQAVGQISPKDLGKLGLKIFTWFFFITILGAIIGIGVGFLVQPGVGLPKSDLVTTIKPTTQTISDTILNFFPNNIVQSMGNGSMIQIIVFALFLGVALSKYTAKTGDKSLLDLLTKCNALLLDIIKAVMTWVAPIGVGALLAVVAGNLGLKVFLLMIKYLGGLSLAVIIIMAVDILITAAWCKVNPVRLAGKLINMTLVAATTTSSAVTLPTKMQDSEEKLGVSKRISNLVNPLGMALNSGGQAIFISMASIMFIQFFQLDISLGRLIQIIAVAVLGCMGSMAVPGGGLVVLISMMPVVGLPMEGIALIAGVDWFRGAITTIPNVDCDALVAMCIAKDEGELDYEIFNGTKVYVDESTVKTTNI
jgi:Na+/H+-dicarboxylate symporter